MLKRTDISASSIGDTRRTAILAAGDVLKRSAVIKPEADVQAVAAALIDSTFAARLPR